MKSRTAWALGTASLALALTASCSDASGGSNFNTGGTAATASGGSNSGGSGGTFGDGSNSGGAGGGIGGGCASDTYGGVLLPLDLYLILDRSSSMSDSGKWTNVTGAINQFVALPGLDGLSMGLAFFPVPKSCTLPADCGLFGQCNGGKCTFGPFADSCEPTDYAAPTVPMAPFPGVAAQITSAIGATSPNGGTPTLYAIQGAVQYARGWAQAHTDHLTAVVLATDGEPAACGNVNNVTNCANEAGYGFNGNPSVPVFVIGVGDLGALNTIAQSGGTNAAILLDAANAGQSFLDALNQIRGAVGCQYQVPDPPVGQTLDPTHVNVAFTPDGGSQSVYGHVDSAADCQGKLGWYYDNNAAPTKILFCPATCDVVTHQQGAVDIVVGCSTIPA